MDSQIILNNSLLGNRYLIDDTKITKICELILSCLDVTNELSVSFVSESEIASLNNQYRDKNKSTDVLSFPQIDWETPLCFQTPYTEKVPSFFPLGDVVLCLEKAEENSKEIVQGIDREVCFLLIHGILHLCGHDHIEKEEEKVMLHQQELILNFLQANHPECWLDCVTLTNAITGERSI